MHLYVEIHRVDTANSGKAKYIIYANPELEKSSVETLYGVPKAICYGKEKVQATNLKGNENCSGMNQ